VSKDELINKEFLHQLFEYKDGVLYWKTKWSDKIVIGNPVGYLRNGYLGTKINKIDYKNHRLIFMMHYGYLPKTIDHIDGNPLNNKIENLREATSSQNGYNKKISKANTSGKKGVFWKKDRNKYKVEITINSNPTFFGYYKDFELACLVADEVRNKYHKEFARHE